MIRKVELTMNEQEKYEVIKRLAETNGNKSRTPAVALPGELRDAVALLYENKYFGANFCHFTELLALHEGIRLSAGTVRSILLARGVLSPKARRSTRKALREKLQARKEATASKKRKRG